MTSPTSLAKITQPGLPDILERKRLFEQLDNAKGRQVIWVAAPPGAGKTTLVCSYLERRKMSCLWYQMDENDADIATFFHYMGLAGKKAAPRRRKPLPHMTTEFRHGLPAFARLFFSDLFQRLQPPFALVFDNYHEIPSDSKLHEAIRNSVDALPENGVLIMISRTDPPPALARAEANQQLAVLGWKDLSLTQDESQAIAKLFGVRDVKDVLQNLHGKAEGWVAGLVLMLERVKAGKPVTDIINNATSDRLFDYFAAEIFERASEETRQFLLQTAFLPSMTVRMAEDLTRNPNARQLLVQLNRHHYFTEKLSEREALYQYHPLFREFLLTRAAAQLDEDTLSDLQQRAASLLELNGQIEAAVQLLKQVREWSRLGTLICTHARTFLQHGRSQVLEEWLRYLPPAMIEKTPWLAYWLGACQLSHNLSEARHHLDRAFALFMDQQDAAGSYMAWSSIVDTYLYEWGNFTGLDKWIELLPSLVQTYGDPPSTEISAHLTTSMFSALMYRQPQHADFSRWEERARTLVQSDADLQHRVVVGNHLMLYYSWRGDLAKTSLIMDILRTATQQPDIDPLALIIWRSMEGMHKWLTLDNEGCLETIESGLEMAEATGVRIWNFMLNAQGMYGAINASDLGRAAELLDNMSSLLESHRRLDAAHYHYQAASLALLQHDLPRAHEHAQAAVERADEAGSPFPQTLVRLGLAQVQFEREQDEAAAETLRQALELNKGLKSHYIEYHKLMLEAYFHLTRNRSDEARALLQAAFALAHEHGYMTMTWWRPDVMSRLCAFALSHNIEPEYVNQLIRRQNLLPEGNITDINNWPWAIKVYTLGRFSLLVNGEPLRFSARAQSKPLELLKCLIANGGREVTEHRFLEALWPDAEGDAAHRAFDTTLHRLRKLTGNDKALVLQEGRLTLDPRYCWVDVWALERMLGRLDYAITECKNAETLASMMDRVLALYQGPFLGDAGDTSWAISLRERLHSRLLRQLGAAGKYWEDQAAWSHSIDYYRRILEIDPVAEEFYQRLMISYLALGRRAEALTTYKRCQNMLESLLGVQPSPGTESIREKILSNQ